MLRLSRSASVFCLPAASRTRLPSLAPRSLALSLLPPPPPLYRHLLHRVDMDFSDVPPEALEDEDAFAVGGTATPCSCSVPLAPLTNRLGCVCMCGASPDQPILPDTPVVDAAQEARINEKRRKIAGEVLSTEESYVQSLLILIEVSTLYDARSRRLTHMLTLSLYHDPYTTVCDAPRAWASRSTRSSLLRWRAPMPCLVERRKSSKRSLPTSRPSSPSTNTCYAPSLSVCATGAKFS